uniref:peptidyl-tRNA hydrolase n=1 Tax=Strigamia maritima TaxID=126957 RepID=T1J3I5_STRMM
MARTPGKKPPLVPRPQSVSTDTNDIEDAKRKTIELIGTTETSHLENRRDLEFRMDFVLTTRNCHPGSIAKTIAVSALTMQRMMLEEDENFGDCLDAWAEAGMPVKLYRGRSRDHLIAIKEQAEAVNLPVLSTMDAQKRPKHNAACVICIFGPITKLHRIVKSLPPF